MPKTRKERISALATQWDHIEKRLKEAENVRREVVHAAVNELRYAGRALVDVWHLPIDTQSDEEAARLDEKITVAEQYLMNSNHDITDGVCFVLHSKVQDLLEFVPRRKIRKEFPDLDNFLQKLDEANDIVTESRETRKDRKEKYEYLEKTYVPYLLENFKLLDYAERKAEQRLLRSRWFSIFGYVVGAIGLVGSFASILSVDLDGTWIAYIYEQVAGAISTENTADILDADGS